MACSSDRSRVLGVIALVGALVSITFVAYAETLDNGFLLWDDDLHVTAQPRIRELSPRSLLWMATALEAENWHPLAWLSHAVDYRLFGLSPRGHHATSVVIHCLNTVWVFVAALFVIGVARRPEQRLRLASADPPLLAAAGAAALLFGVHPQHVESVAWVAERKDVLFPFFGIPALLAHCAYARAASPAARRGAYALALALFALALASKPMAIVLPPVMLLLDVYPLRRLWGDGAAAPRVSLARALGEKAPFFGLALVAAALGVAAQGDAVVGLGQRGVLFRVFTATGSVPFLLSKLVWPADLSPLYVPPPDYGGFAGKLRLFLPRAAFVALATLLCAQQWRRGRPWWGAAWLFYLITLAPVSGLVQVGSQVSADRYAYLTTLPAYLLAGAGAGALLRRSRVLGGVALVGLLAVALVLAARTREQTRVWRDDVTFWTHVEARAPHYHTAQAALARAHLERGRCDLAVPHYRAAIETDPTHFGDHFNLGACYLELGRRDEAIAPLERAAEPGLRRGPPPVEARADLAELWCRHGSGARAQELARRSLALDPAYAPALAVLARARAGACR